MLDRFLRKKPKSPRLQKGFHLISSAPLLLEPHRQATLEIRTALGLPHSHDQALLTPLLHGYAEFCQQLPASEAHHHSDLGGLLKHGLETALYALRAARTDFGTQDQAHVEEEEQRAHRSRYAILTAALLHDLAKPVVDQQVTLCDSAGNESHWNAWSGPMTDTQAIGYRWSYRRDRNYDLHQGAALLIARQLIPSTALGWLSEDLQILAHWVEFMNGQADKSNFIRKAVSQGDQWSTAKNLAGHRASRPQAGNGNLSDLMIMAMRKCFDDGRLSLNKKGSAAWIHDDRIWLVTKKVLDAAREELRSTGVSGVPADNNRMMDELQGYGVLQQSEEGRAIHQVTIQLEDWNQEFRVLCLKTSTLWPDANTRPDPMQGNVLTDAKASQDSEAASEPQKDSQSVPAAQKLPKQTSPAPQPGPPKQRSDAAPDDPPPWEDEAPTPKPSHEALPPDNHKEDEAELDLDLSKIEYRFIQWIREGLQTAELKCNTKDALTHGLDEGLFLVSPQTFKNFAATEMEEWKSVQRRFQRLNLHTRTPGGTNVWQVTVEGDRGSSRLSGLLIPKDTKEFGAFPPPNPHLQLVKQDETEN